MPDPNFETQTHAEIKGDVLLDYTINRPAADAEEAADIDIKADILAGNVKHLQWRQVFILRQLFSETQEMPYLILAARNLAGIDWDDGTRAQGFIQFSRQSAAGVDYLIPAGTVLVSSPDADGNVFRASLLYDAILKTGETYTIGIAEVVEVQGVDLVKYEIPSSGGGVTTIAQQQIGTGLSGNLPENTFAGFEAAPPTGIEAVANLSAGYARGTGWNSGTLFTISVGVDDQINVNIDGTGVQTITLAAGANLSGAVVATDIQAKLRAIGTGGYSLALCLYNMTETGYRFIIFSGTTGSASSVSVSAGTNDASILLGFDQSTEINGGTGFTGGLDPQTEGSLKSEYETAIRKGGESGTAADYVTWAKDSGQSVDDAKVTGLTGAVDIFPVSLTGALFTQNQLDAITTFIETKAPVHLIGSIRVLNPTVLSIYVSATIVLTTGFLLSNISDEIKKAIRDYVATVPLGDAGGTAIVRYNKISSAILEINGVEDVTGLLTESVDPPTATVNIVLADGELAQTDDTKITLI